MNLTINTNAFVMHLQEVFPFGKETAETNPRQLA